MLAKIKSIGEVNPDIDNGKTYKRFMVNIKNVKQYLNYPDVAGNFMIDDAIKLAKEKYGNLEGIAQQYLFYWKRDTA